MTPSGRHASGAAGRYAFVRYPWRARVDTRSPLAARQYAALIGQTLRYGMPARRRFGTVLAVAGRRGIPERLVASGLARFPKVADRRLDQLLDALADRWDELHDRSARLPAAPPMLTALGLDRSAGLTVFVFGEAPAPLLVAKLSAGGAGRIETEVKALRRAEGAAVAPLDLGTVGDAFVQEGLGGAPLRVEPLTPARAAGLRWTDEHEELAAALVRLASSTASATRPPTLAARVERALAHEGLAARARGSLAAAWRDVRGLEVAVLRHCDASAQNCLYSGRRLTGIVDWELAEVCGAPGFDVYNSALSYIEHGLGLVEWSQELAVEALARSWEHAPFWARARAAAREAARAAGVPDDRLDSLELVFFGSRIGDRLLMPEVKRGTDTATSARMCEIVAGA